MDLELAGRSVIVTGSTRGIGFGIAEAFAREGAKLTICARGADALDDARERLARPPAPPTPRASPSTSPTPRTASASWPLPWSATAASMCS